MQGDAAQVVDGHCGIWIVRPEDTALNVQRLTLQFLCVYIVAFEEEQVSQIVHRHQRVSMVRSEDALADGKRFPQQFLRLIQTMFLGQGGGISIHQRQGVRMLGSENPPPHFQGVVIAFPLPPIGPRQKEYWPR